MTELTVRLVEIAAELGESVDKIIARLDDPNNSVLLDSVGFRCIETAVARRLLDEHRTRVESHTRYRREAREALREQADATHPRHRVKAVQERQQRLRAEGKLDPDMSAYAAMCANDTQADLDGRLSRRMDGWLSDKGNGARFVIRP